MTNGNTQEALKDEIGRRLIWTVLGIAGIWVAWFWGARAFGWALGLGDDIQTAGVLGDSFGAINTLFTGIAMAGAVGSFAYQQKTIRDQHEAQKQQQEEIAQQQKQFRDTHVERLKSRFEQSFFELLQLSRELRAKISFRHSQQFKQMTNLAGPREILTGDAAFNGIRTEVNMMWQYGVGGIPSVTDEHPVGTYYAASIHASHEDQLGPYFRIIYTMLRRISEASFLDEDEKVGYGNLLRSQLTSTELFVIAVNGLAKISGDLDKYLAEFKMFKYLNLDDKTLLLGDWKALYETYPESAFEGRPGKDV